MTIGFRLGSLDEEGMQHGTTWDPSLTAYDPSSIQLRDKKRKRPKRVRFDLANLAHNELWREHGKQRMKGSHPRSVQLRQLAHDNSYKSSFEQKLPTQNNTSRTTQTCWTELQQVHVQQQPATISEKSFGHKRCPSDNLGSFSEGDSITNMQACRSQEQQNNTSSLGLGTKNPAAFGILIDTGAAVSVAPRSFASHIALSPVESTFQLKTITGNQIEAFGRRTVWLAGSELNLVVSFVIADVQEAVLGMDIMLHNQLSLLGNSFHEYYLVNSLGAKTKLESRGLHLYMGVCPTELGLSTLRGSNFQEENESLLDDKGRTPEGACAASGGECKITFLPEKLRNQQDKNTAALGTTASQTRGATKKKRRKKKTPSAEKASPETLQKRSLEPEGQTTAASKLRVLEKTSLMNEIELAAEEPLILGKMEQEELSLRILLTLSLRKRWLITTTRAACSEQALGEQLRSLGLEQNKVDSNIFSGDELVLLVHDNNLLIGGTEEQQECLLCELSASMCLDELEKLEEGAQVLFHNRTLEYKASSNTIQVALPQSFYMQLLERHELEEAECTTTLAKEELWNNASEQTLALDDVRTKLYKQTVGELEWAASACRPDLSFEVHLLTQSFNCSNHTR